MKIDELNKGQNAISKEQLTSILGGVNDTLAGCY
jgi:hypothetical protein